MIKIILFIFSFQLYAAQNYVSPSNLSKAVSGQAGVVIYSSRKSCDKKTGEQCIPFDSAVDVSVMKISPANSAYNLNDCADTAACQTLILPDDYCDPGDAKFFGDLDESGDMEGWCIAAKEKLTLDPALKSAKDTAKAAADAAQQAKAQARAERKTRLDTADIDSMVSVPDIKQVLKDLVAQSLDQD